MKSKAIRLLYYREASSPLAHKHNSVYLHFPIIYKGKPFSNPPLQQQKLSCQTGHDCDNNCIFRERFSSASTGSGSVLLVILASIAVAVWYFFQIAFFLYFPVFFCWKNYGFSVHTCPPFPSSPSQPWKGNFKYFRDFLFDTNYRNNDLYSLESQILFREAERVAFVLECIL